MLISRLATTLSVSTDGGKGKVQQLKGVVTTLLSKHCWVAFDPAVGAPKTPGKYQKDRMVFAALQGAATSISKPARAATSNSEPALAAATATVVEVTEAEVGGSNGGGNGGVDGSAVPSAAPEAASTGVWEDALNVFN